MSRFFAAASDSESSSSSSESEDEGAAFTGPSGPTFMVSFELKCYSYKHTLLSSTLKSYIFIIAFSSSTA